MSLNSQQKLTSSHLTQPAPNLLLSLTAVNLWLLSLFAVIIVCMCVFVFAGIKNYLTYLDVDTGRVCYAHLPCVPGRERNAYCMVADKDLSSIRKGLVTLLFSSLFFSVWLSLFFNSTASVGRIV